MDFLSVYNCTISETSILHPNLIFALLLRYGLDNSTLHHIKTRNLLTKIMFSGLKVWFVMFIAIMRIRMVFSVCNSEGRDCPVECQCKIFVKIRDFVSF